MINISKVKVENETKKIELPITSNTKPVVSQDIVTKWQHLLDLSAQILDVPSALIMKLNQETIEVFASSDTEDNPYHKGATEELGLGLYCETVVGKNQKLHVPNANKSAYWKNNPDAKDGMVSYLGFPIVWSDGEIFGTFCALDNKENNFSETYQDVLIRFKNIVESDLNQLILLTKLRESDEKYRALYKNSPLAYQSLDNEGKIKDINPQWLNTLGYKREEVIGKWFGDFLSPDYKEHFRKNFRNFKKKGKVSGVEFKMLRRDKAEIYVSFEGCIGYDEQGNFKQTYCTFKDITKQKTAENKISEKNEQLETIIKGANLGWWDWDIPSGDEIYNEILVENLGYKLNEITPHLSWWEDKIHPDDNQQVNLDLQAHFAGKTEFYKNKHRLRTKAGEWKWFLDYGKVVERDSKGKPIRMIGTLRDIDYEERAKEKITSSLQQIKVINANIPNIIWKADIDEQLNFTNSYISAEVDKYLGLPQGSIDNSCNKYFTYILPQYLPQIFDLFKKGLKHPNHLFSYDYEVQKADDKLAWFSTSGRVIIEDNKQTVYGSTIDITEQKKGEHALKEREEKLRNIFQNSTNLFYSHTPDHTLTYVSPQIENVLGYTQEEAMIKWTDLATDNPINQIGFQNTLKAINTGNRQPTYNLELIRKDGKKIIVEVRESPVIENDQVTSIVGSLTDVTDRIKAERELNKSRRRLKIMNSILRHDIMNDLVAMKSALKIYRHKKNEAILAEIEKRVKKGINTIKKQRKQQDFIDEYSMLDKMEMAKIASDVRKNHPEIKINIQGQGTAFADNAIYSVFDNLIANAIKHGKASTLDIDIEADENYCTMRIADNGIGIPDKYKDNVFEEGFQFGDSGNTGIGLFIVKQTIEGYDGEITVEDNQPQGTLFCIRLRRIIEK